MCGQYSEVKGINMQTHSMLQSFEKWKASGMHRNLPDWAGTYGLLARLEVKSSLRFTISASSRVWKHVGVDLESWLANL